MVRLVKLNTGEELIGTITENTIGNTFLMKDIVMMAMVAEQRIGFINYLPYADLKNGITFKMDSIMFMVPVNPKLENEYRASLNKVVIAREQPTLKIAE